MKRRDEYSQNFLRSPELVKELLHRTNIAPEDTVYDIGAGSGVITSVLATRVKAVVAIEYDEATTTLLRKNVGELPNVQVVRADYLALSLPQKPYKVFANIPFHLSSAIITRWINTPHAPTSAYLIVQKQFGKKLVATDTTHFTSQLGMAIGAEYAVRVVQSLKRTDFWPHPAVDTVFIELVRRKEPLVSRKRMPAYIRFTQECFSDRAKLAKMPLHILGATAGISPSSLSLAQWILLFNSQTVY